MSKSNVKGEKIQIVAFSTNESENSPNDLINVYLEKNNHVIIKKNSFAIAFTTTLPKTSKQTKIMICSVLNLSKDYTGISDVNCYIIYVDLEKEESKEKFQEILNYITENCDTGKKFFVFGMKKEKDGEKFLKKEDIEKCLENIQAPYDYGEINLNDSKDICNSLEKVFNYSYIHPLSGEFHYEKEEKQDGSCGIF